ncbi:reprolysin-like metallopeptidase [Fulvivirga lutimaris]|uniref:reprolysin-like metallopeptidase n=1 Tax=Fulvivirga lutimaris TaxID=1819566 RepID=UPI0012BC505E|nr:zinc-dependent metalloprotease family protein [Fulvivirga lutimaris]MTI39281.1 T9SS type A sorting domain-containing protein [Fulvivirga lutimaris]
MRITLFILTTIFLANTSYSQSDELWVPVKSNTNLRSSIPVTKSLNYELQKEILINKLKGISESSSRIVNLPLANGELKQFTLSPNNLLPPGLSAKYPEIQTFEAISLDGKIHGKVDLTSAGFHGMLFTKEGTVFIDPISKENNTTHQVYYKQDFEAYSKAGITDDQLLNKNGIKSSRVNLSSKQTYNSRASGTELRTYRLAITTTGEYTIFQGGTVSDALSAIATTMNRVNGIYEKEVSIRFELIDNTDELIYINPDTDPYTNENKSDYIDQVQANIDLVIEDANYDVGHGFSTSPGGLAGTGPCISGRKASGVTGTNNPVGDPYDVDFVAHEIGHQLGANHTFNGTASSCSGDNRNPSTAYEPGSGSTILGYAGICSPQDLQNNSDAYFHTISYDEILNYTVNGSGSSCGTITSTGNTPPEIDAGNSGFTIPINTPFSLTGIGSDADGDELTYNWEQFDLGPAGSPDSPLENAPIFRSFTPQPNPSRTFPQLSDILNNTQTLGELLPTYSRTLTFRLTARDNKSGGGGVNYDQIAFDVTEAAGPFVINSFNTNSELTAQSNTEILWDVANTDTAPINCQNVNILLSDDGGLTFSHILKSNTPNDGVENVLIPDIVSSNVRIRVEASDNIFFDINDADINVTAPVEPDFFLEIDAATLEVCGSTDSNISILIGSILNFSNEITLSVSGLEDGLSASFSSNPVTPGNETMLTFSNSNQSANGNYPVIITASDGKTQKVANISLIVFDGIDNVIQILNPIDNQIDVSLNPMLIWNETSSYNYNIEIATDEGFDNIVASENSITSGSLKTPLLEAGTTYFWRVSGTNGCETTGFKNSSFTTVSCSVTTSIDIPKSISADDPSTITSEVTINSSGKIGDVNIINLSGTHSFLEDLEVTLKSPLGTQVILFSTICGDKDNFNLNFDQQSPISSFDCPPTAGDTYRPIEDLNAFNGEEMNGVWTLSISDNAKFDGGTLQSWSLEICGENSNQKPNPPSNLKAVIVNGTDINLTWTDNSDNEHEFSIERSTEDNTSFEEIGKVGADITEYTDTGISLDNNYYYRVVAILDTDTSNYSNIVDVISVPLTPFGLETTEVTATSASLAWQDDNDSKDSFTIEKASETGSFEFLISVSESETIYTDESVDPATIYRYRVKTLSGGKESKYSDELTVETLPLPPAAPDDLILDLISLERINLTWVDNADNEDGFVLERSVGDNSNFELLDSLSADILSYQDLTLGEPDVYFYRIKAFNIGGESPYSDEVSESSLVLNTADRLKTAISIYPNPSNGVFNIKAPENSIIHLFDMVGSLVNPVAISHENGIYSLDISNQADGIYIIKLSVNQNNTILKVIKSTH